MFPAFAHFRRTATADTELAGQTIREGEKVVMWYVSSGRDAELYDNADSFNVRRFDARRPPEEREPPHQAFGAGGRHFCLGVALARLELRIMFEETLARYPEMEISGRFTHVESGFISQLKTLPVKLGPRASAAA
jgi:cholest-4-en-3-one 26-monooxygenase